jgi:hypothetical protein
MYTHTHTLSLSLSLSLSLTHTHTHIFPHVYIYVVCMYVYIYVCTSTYNMSVSEIGTDTAAALLAHQCSGCSTRLYISSVCVCVCVCVVPCYSLLTQRRRCRRITAAGARGRSACGSGRRGKPSVYSLY